MTTMAQIGSRRSGTIRQPTPQPVTFDVSCLLVWIRRTPVHRRCSFVATQLSTRVDRKTHSSRTGYEMALGSPIETRKSLASSYADVQIDPNPTTMSPGEGGREMVVGTIVTELGPDALTVSALVVRPTLCRLNNR